MTLLKNLVTRRNVCLFWVLLAIFCWVYPYLIHRGNNFRIFAGVYDHLVHNSNLYSEYGDINHHGPLFGLLIAPFALLPTFLGGLLWNLFNAAALLYAIYQLPIETKKQNTILLLSSVSFAHSQYEMQSSAFITSLIILSFVFTLKKRESLATLLIAIGFLIKLYPVIGLAFIIFSSNKIKFAGWFLIWLAALIFLPMLISSPGFVLTSYSDWILSLIEKDALNTALSATQDYSIMGLFRRVFHDRSITNIPFLLFGAIAFGLGLWRFNKLYALKKQLNTNWLKVKLNILSTALILVVLFSSSSESQTYIIAVTGCFIWLVMQDTPFNQFNLILVLFLIIFTGLGPTGLFPKSIRELLITHFVMMSWPCIAIWLRASWELITIEERLYDPTYEKYMIHVNTRFQQHNTTI